MIAMNVRRAILAGVIVWALVFVSFTLMSILPGVKDSTKYQSVVISVLMIPFAVWGARIYYKQGGSTNGMLVGVVMATTALVLDALITVPLVEIPYNGSSYAVFFTNPLLWILVCADVLVVYLFWRWRIRI